MTVYILHFNQALGHAKHYTGYSGDVVGRVMDHMEGHGSRLTQVLKERGIKFALARTFDGADRRFERRLKKTHNVGRYCPICQGSKVREYLPVEEKDHDTSHNSH